MMAPDLTVPIVARLGNTEVQIGHLSMPAEGDDTFVEVDQEQLRLARSTFTASG
ncbi:hypothetical protein [Nonomuraea wenchangensis]|uniref:hypothetical protein n=1 Tax=Nonomuraea wenchangensis TaxID=568860 RepID=UPI00332A7E16